MNKKIVFLGSPDFALPSLKALHSNYDVVGVVTQPDRPAGRGQQLQAPDVKVLALDLGLPVIQPKTLREPEAMAMLQDWSPDVIVVAAFGQILREDVLSMPPFGCVNVHASLLPRWRGAAPVQTALLYDDQTGVTIMKMDAGLDTGPILSQREIPIDESITAGELFDQLAGMGADLLIDTLPNYFTGEIQPQPQDESWATYAPRLKKSDGLLDFTHKARFLARQVRAYNPWPGAFCFYEKQRLKIYQAHTLDNLHREPGCWYSVGEKPALGTKSGLLVLDEVQLAGKRRMGAEDFLRGLQEWNPIEVITF
jgi:methionyl-tRNA formyltransferase